MSFPAPSFIQSGATRIAVYEAGTPSKRPPVVLVHGFPELAYSWRHQIPVLADAGFHVLAPDMRGYGLSDCPEAIEDYDIAHLTGDLLAVLDAHGYDEAIFCGHDWGGLVAWAMPVFHPDRVAGNVGVNTPFQPRFDVDPIALYRKVFGDEMYIVRFQEVGPVDALFNTDPARAVDFFFRKAVAAPKDSDKGEQGELDLIGAFQAGESAWPGEALLSPDDHAVYAAAFERTGFTPALNWYRNMTRNWHLAEGKPGRVSTPCLQVVAELDAALPPRLAEPMKEHCDDLEIYLIKDCAHWTMSEKPDELNRLMIDWLTRRYPSA